MFSSMQFSDSPPHIYYFLSFQIYAVTRMTEAATIVGPGASTGGATTRTKRAGQGGLYQDGGAGGGWGGGERAV